MAHRAMFVALAGWLMSGMAATAQEVELTRCRAINDDAQRLACYDAIPTAAASPRPKYEVIPFQELQEYALSFRGRLVETTGWLAPGERYFSLSESEQGAVALPLDPENLDRRAREDLLEQCGDGCTATVRGRVRPVNFTTGIVADVITVR